MKKFVLIICSIISVFGAVGQPRPYDIDSNFIPEVEYMQKKWCGNYDGVEPNSRKILSINRTLTLNVDSTYNNIVTGQIKNESEILLLKQEKGKYQYDQETQLVTYTVGFDSILDINRYLHDHEVIYESNNYQENGEERLISEKAQFTPSLEDSSRKWVLFDQQLASPIDPRQPAVYVMTGEEIAPSFLQSVFTDKFSNEDCYDMSGRKIKNPVKGIYIRGGKKVIYYRK